MRGGRGYDALIIGLLGLGAVVTGAVWLGAWTATTVTGGRFDGQIVDSLRVAGGYLSDPGRPPSIAWGDAEVPGVWLVYPMTVAWLAGLVAAAVAVAGRLYEPAGGFRARRRLGVDPVSGFAERKELATLWWRRPVPGRFILGRVGRRTLASTNPQHRTDGLTVLDRLRRSLQCSGRAEAFGGVMLIGLSQTGKSQHALTALRALSAAGCPMICSSVKGDIIEHLLAQRRRVGQVGIFDPTGKLRDTYEARQAHGLSVPAGWDKRLCVGWSPLDGVTTYDHAVAAAHRLAEAGPGMEQVTGGDFWKSQAEMLIAPLLWIAARTERDMGDVTMWVLAEDRPEPEPDKAGTARTPEPIRCLGPLITSRDPAVSRDARKAEQVLYGLWNKADTTVGSVYATANTILRPWVTEEGRRSSTGDLANLGWLLSGGGNNTLAISAPPQEQRQLRPVLAGAVSSILDAVYRHVGTHGPLDPPLVVFLDEIGNAPLARLPEYLSTLASAGVLLITVWQDVSQIKKAYGDHAGSILSNSRHVLVFGGTKDTATLDWVRQILGDEAANTTSATSNTGELLNGSVSASQQLVPLTPGNVLREMPHTHALLISANNRPVEVRHIPEHTVDTFKPLRHWPYPATSTLGLPTIGPDTGDSAPDEHADLYNTERHAAAHQLAALFASPTARAIASLHALARLWPGRRRYRPGNTSGGGSTTTHRPQPNRKTAPSTSPGSRPQRTRATVRSSLAPASRDLGQMTEREGGRLARRQTNPTDDHPTTVIETAGIEHLL